MSLIHKIVYTVLCTVITISFLALSFLVFSYSNVITDEELVSYNSSLMESNRNYEQEVIKIGKKLDIISNENSDLKLRMSSLSKNLKDQHNVIADLTIEKEEIHNKLVASNHRLRLYLQNKGSLRQAHNKNDISQGLVTEEKLALESEISELTVIIEDLVEQRDNAIIEANKVKNRQINALSELELMKARQDKIFKQLEGAVDISLDKMRKGLDNTDIKVDKLILKASGGKGGPFHPLNDSIPEPNEDWSVQNSRVNILFEKLSKVKGMIDLSESMPLSDPLGSYKYRISSSFGARTDPINKKKSMHKGLDFAAPKGTKIITAADGKVIFAGSKSGYGKVVYIKHLNGFETRYAHMSKILVKKGQKVKSKDVIGLVGSTGRSTGNHLHYEVLLHKKHKNPKKYLKAGRQLGF